MASLLPPDATTAAFSIPLSVSQSQIANVRLIGGVGADEVELKFYDGVSITDSEDSINVSKKVLNLANTLRRINGPVELLVVSAGTTAAVQVEVFIDA